jgi:hypothetical protein
VESASLVASAGLLESAALASMEDEASWGAAPSWDPPSAAPRRELALLHALVAAMHVSKIRGSRRIKGALFGGGLIAHVGWGEESPWRAGSPRA